MKKLTKRVLSVFLALAMIVTILPPMTAQAAKATNIILYKGDKYQFTNFYDITSVASSKKAVVSIARDKKKKYYANATAKKLGKSTLTIKTKRGTLKYVATVADYKFDVSFKKVSDSDLLMVVKNNTKTIFDAVSFKYTLCDATGEPITRDDIILYSLIPGKCSYKMIHTYGQIDVNTLDLSACTAEATGNDRRPTSKYANLSSKIATKVTEETFADGIQLTVRITNNAKSEGRGDAFVLVYDENNNVLGVEDISVYSFGSGDIKTETIKLYNYKYGAYHHYKVVPAIYLRK